MCWDFKNHDFVRPIDDQPQSSKQVINLSVFKKILGNYLYILFDILGTSFETSSVNFGENWLKPNLSTGSTDILDDWLFLKP